MSEPRLKADSKATQTKRDRSPLHFGTIRARIATILAAQFATMAGTAVVLFATGTIKLNDNSFSGTFTLFLVLIAVIGLAEFGLAIAVALALTRTITGPLGELLRATRNLATGSKARAHVEPGDEIGDLAQSFNAMVSAIEMRERKITHAALHDALTGLPNRQYFVEQLDHALLRRRDGTQVLVAYIDLDDFKMVNDTLGHDAGDRLLRDVSAQLQAEFPDDLIARLSGDEFAAMIRDIPANADVARLAMRLQGCFARSIVLNGDKAEVSASIGIAIAPEDGVDAPVLLKNADLALYRTKHEGKAGHHFFEPELDERARLRRQLELDLRSAIRDGGFHLHFQPLYNLSEDKLTAFEALVRWNHPTLGMMQPADFIPLAEETGLIMEIGEWVMREACRQAKTWPEALSVTVNLSPKQFLSPTLQTMVVQALTASDLPPQRLEVEITESALSDNAEKTLHSLHALQGLGVRVTLDDFGIGYTSLSHLRLFPFNKLKIDQTFVRDLNSEGNAHAVIRAIVTLADALGIETLAEGVEEVGQLSVLRDEGCQQIQGYLLSRPITSEQVAPFIMDLSARSKIIRLRA